MPAWTVAAPGADRRRAHSSASRRGDPGARSAARSASACTRAGCAAPICTSPRVISAAARRRRPGHEVVGIVDARGAGVRALRRRRPDRHPVAAPHVRASAGGAGAAPRTSASRRRSPAGTPTAATRSTPSSTSATRTRCPIATTTSTRRRCSARASSATARSTGGAPARRPARASTGSARPRTSSRRSR